MPMKARTLRNSFKGCPPAAKPVGFSEQSVVHVQIGSEYEVHALSVFSRVTFLLIVDDLGMFSWLPAWLFEVSERRMPTDWIVSLFNDDPSAVIGPPLIAENLETYSRFVEQEPELVNAMRERIQATG